MVYVHHIFFIHPSVDGHSGCFHVFAVVNGAAVDTGVLVSFRSYFSLDICPGANTRNFRCQFTLKNPRLGLPW